LAGTASTSGLHALNDTTFLGASAAGAARLRLTTERRFTMRAKRLTLQQRQELFHELVTNQDMGMSVAESRQQMSQQYEITEDDVKKIEDEGIEKEWPPLNEAAHPIP
jgi:hypothetical protein